jgi:hypothetical protein
MRNFYLVDFRCFGRSAYLIHQILGFPVSFPAAQAVASPLLVACAVGFIACEQYPGITLSLAIANSVLLNQSMSSIETILPSVESGVV